MGLAIGAVIIRKNADEFANEDIIQHFFGPAYTEILETNLYESKFDTRLDDCIGIYKMPNFIIISNYRFTTGFYNASAIIDKAYEYFKHPAQIFAFENYDSGGTYSYAIITRGKLMRSVRLTGDDKHPKTYGEPLNIEQKLLRAKKTTELASDGVRYTYYIHPDTKQLIEESGITITLLWDVMHHEVDMFPDTLWDKATERHYFRLHK